MRAGARPSPGKMPSGGATVDKDFTPAAPRRYDGAKSAAGRRGEPCRIPPHAETGETMKYGARNEIIGTVKSVKTGDVMSLVKFEVRVPCEMASVLTTESVEHLGIKPGDQLKLDVEILKSKSKIAEC